MLKLRIVHVFLCHLHEQTRGDHFVSLFACFMHSNSKYGRHMQFDVNIRLYEY